MCRDFKYLKGWCYIMIYWIPENNIDELNRKLARIEKKCNQHACKFNYHTVSSEFRDFVFDDGTTGKLKYFEISVEGCAKINNWELSGIIEHSHTSGNVIYDINQNHPIPKCYYTVESNCDHCNKQVYRRITAILYNTETLEYRQVGTSCLKLYTGGLDAEAITYSLQFIKTLEGYQTSSIGSCKRYYSVATYLKYVAECTIKFGFYPTSAEYSTKSRAFDTMRYIEFGRLPLGLDETRFKSELSCINFDANSEEVLNIVNDMMIWAKDLTHKDTSAFMHNLSVLLNTDYVTSQDFGILACSVHTYLKWLEEHHLQDNSNSGPILVSNYVGNIKDKLCLDITSGELISQYYSDYGPVYLYEFKDADGNIFIWRTSIYLEDIDTVSKISGTVKSHEEYRKQKQTVLTRCKILARNIKASVDITDSEKDSEKGLQLFFASTE